ncbi:hypothetical protein [Paenibacillus sp. GCM10023250]|uniref:hypothetical protein n=1 Tax=Paenibacillus sp. GCM10023250 TaxID=3252648 RepID=UPI00361182D0
MRPGADKAVRGAVAAPSRAAGGGKREEHGERDGLGYGLLHERDVLRELIDNDFHYHYIRNGSRYQ